MTNLEKLKLAFSEGLGMDMASVTDDLQYGNPGWDSVGHMALVAAIERAFDVMLDTKDVIGMSPFAKAKEFYRSMEPPFSLKGKVALITGSARGIGWACARVLAQHGATVLLNGQTNSEQLQARVAEIKSTFQTEADGFGFDVGSPDAVKECYAAIFKKYKRLDVLVNNAGVLEEGLLAMVSPESLEKTFHVNVQGVILNMQYASRLMARNGGGAIINLSSILGRVGNAGTIVYAGSKAAVIGITLSAAKELASAGIRVNAVAPGFIDTDMTRRLAPDKQKEKLASIGMRRIGTPEEVAGAVLFFATGLSSYVTGQVLGVDGGMLV